MSSLPRAPKVDAVISEEIIDQSKKQDSSHCMIAEAVKVAYPDAVYVSVDVQTIRFSDLTRGQRFTYLTPRNAQIGLIKFDQGIDQDPFVVRLRSGQVTKAGTRKASLTTPRKKDKLPNKATLASGGSGASIPTIRGGKAPPLTSIGRRREFGLRSMRA